MAILYVNLMRNLIQACIVDLKFWNLNPQGKVGAAYFVISANQNRTKYAITYKIRVHKKATSLHLNFNFKIIFYLII